MKKDRDFIIKSPLGAILATLVLICLLLSFSYIFISR